MSARIISIALCAATLAGCGEGEPERPPERRGGERPSRPAPLPMQATAPAGPGPATGGPMTPEAVYAEAVEAFAEVAAATSPSARQRVLAEAAERVPRWYAALKLPPPDTSEPEWLTTVLWDTMPAEEYRKAVENAKPLFLEHGRPFPESATRREFMKALAELPKQAEGSK